MSDGARTPSDWAIRLRPHHVLCSIGFQGRGYSHGFVENMSAIVDGILRAPNGDATLVDLTRDADELCGPCPRRTGSSCTCGDNIARLDARHAAALGITPGTRLSWGELRERAKASVVPDDLDWLCEGCQWLSLGLCKNALRALSETPD